MEQRREMMEEIWKWWEEELKYEGGIKWRSLKHKGPVFPPPYKPLPDNIKFYYNRKPMKLSLEAEEVASLYAKRLDHKLTKDETFCKNFFTDWKETMSLEEKEVIASLAQCDFSEMADYYQNKKKNLSEEEKLQLKKANDKVQQEFGYFFLDDHKQRIEKYKIRPPGLFVGRNSPNRGKLKKKILPKDITINCSKDAEIPKPPQGHSWGKVQHNPQVIWLASWKEGPSGKLKYMMPHASSKLMGEKDLKKYEAARSLKHHREQIQKKYRQDWDSENKQEQQRGVVLYLIDTLALRVGNKTKEGEMANTFGCSSLRVKHVTLHEGETNKIEFNFMGKSSIPYKKMVPVEKEVFRNLQLFKEKKKRDEYLFDQVNPQMLNTYLKGLTKGLTTKVFRTHIASSIMEQQLKNLTHDHSKDKVKSFNEAHRKVAEFCNHQQPKTFEQWFEVQAKFEASRDELSLSKKKLLCVANSSNTEDLKNDVKRKEEALRKLEVKISRMEENKQLNLNSSKLYYIDPRITVAWCLKWGVPVEKIYTKTQRDKFAWAIQMNNENFEF